MARSQFELASLRNWSIFQNPTLTERIPSLLGLVPKTMQGFLEHVLHRVAGSKSVNESEKHRLAENFVAKFKEPEGLFNHMIKSLGSSSLIRYSSLASFLKLVEGSNIVNKGIPFGGSDLCANYISCRQGFISNEFGRVLSQFYFYIIQSPTIDNINLTELLLCLDDKIGIIISQFVNSTTTNTQQTIKDNLCTLIADIPDAVFSAADTLVQNQFGQCEAQPISNQVIYGAASGGVVFLAIVAAVCFFSYMHKLFPCQKTETSDPEAEVETHQSIPMN